MFLAAGKRFYPYSSLLPVVSAPTMIRCVAVFQKWPGNVRLIKECLSTVHRNCPNRKIFYAVDAFEDDWSFLQNLGGQILTLPDGHPPRMNKLLDVAVNQISDEWLWTCEQDVTIDEQTLVQAERLMGQLPPNAAGLELAHYTPAGKLTDPSIGRVKRGTTETGFITWSCTLWRRAALQLIPWDQCAAHGGLDIEACQWIKQRAGFSFFITDQLKATHHPHLSYKAHW